MIFRTNPWLHIFRAPDEGGSGGANSGSNGDAGGQKPDSGGQKPDTGGQKPDNAGGDSPAPAWDYGKWADGLADEGRKDYAKRFKSNEDLLDATLNMRKDLSTRIKVPGKDAAPEDVA